LELAELPPFCTYRGDDRLQGFGSTEEAFVLYGTGKITGGVAAA
jgi:hypothetical protein